jgi:YD repeat-containing protein
LLAGILALTQEADSFAAGAAPGIAPALAEDGLVRRAEERPGPEDAPSLADDDVELIPEEPPEWIHPARWFRSNAGGMTLEEIPSRLAALRNEYALVIDFIGPEELPGYLSPFFSRASREERHYIEVRVLFRDREESRRQWIFRDHGGTTRLVAAFYAEQDNGALAAAEARPSGIPGGFIETYNANQQITAEYRFFDDGEETRTFFLYRRDTLVKGEGWRKTKAADTEETEETEGTATTETTEKFTQIYTDYFRYNRSQYLRSVERIYHELRRDGEETAPLRDPVLLAFPSRVLDAAADHNFIKNKPDPASEFFGDPVVESGYHLVFTTDERGRVMTQTMLDAEEKTLWLIENTWSAAGRIVSSRRTEGDDEKITEYEYDSNGNRMLERNINNGILERVVRSENGRDMEELYMNNAVVLRAVWEGGRKLSEERVRVR